MRTFTRIIGVSGMSNLGVVCPGKIYRSAQPGSLDGLIGMGFKSILNLEESASPIESAPSIIRQIPFRCNVFSDITVDDFHLLNTVMSDPDNQPILIHCLQGHDRTGVVCGGYRAEVDKWLYDEIKEEMVAYGWNPLWVTLEGRLIDFIRSLNPVIPN